MILRCCRKFNSPRKGGRRPASQLTSLVRLHSQAGFRLFSEETSTAGVGAAPAAAEGNAAVFRRNRRIYRDKDAMIALGILIYSMVKFPILKPTLLWRTDVTWNTIHYPFTPVLRTVSRQTPSRTSLRYQIVWCEKSTLSVLRPGMMLKTLSL